MADGLKTQRLTVSTCSLWCYLGFTVQTLQRRHMRFSCCVTFTRSGTSHLLGRRLSQCRLLSTTV